MTASTRETFQRSAPARLGRGAVIAVWASLASAGPALVVSEARAETRVERAIALADQARAARAEGRFEEAYGLYLQAHQLVPAPTMLLSMGACKDALGELIRARELYGEAATMSLPDQAPPPYVEAQQKARIAKARVDARIPRLELVVREGPSARVTVDDDVVPNHRRNRYPVDPGSHVVRAEAAGIEPFVETVHVDEGDTATVDVTLREPGGSTNTIPIFVPWLCLGLGAASLTVGAITGGVTLARAADLKDRCGGGTTGCDPALEPEVSEAAALGHVSTATLVAGGVLAASGVALLVVTLLEDDAAELSLSPRGARFTVSF